MNGELTACYLTLSYSLSDRSHHQFNSSEVGQKLALTLLAKLDPTADPDGLEISPDADLLPRYSKPKVYSAMLPGIVITKI
jgi:hypothetical protein